jgi:hypothetical protein
MFQRYRQRFLLSAAVVGLVAAGAAEAQDVLKQLGLTEAKARQLFMAAATWAVPEQASEIVVTARNAYQALPREARGPVTTGMYAWVNALVNSAAFRAEYERNRLATKPQPPDVEGTVNQEIERRVDRQLAELEETAQVIGSMPADQRKSMEDSIKLQQASYKSAEYAAAQRQDIEQQRAQGKADYDAGMKEWPKNYPADLQVWIARQLRTFLDATSDVDFTLKIELWEGMPISKSSTAKGKSWQWMECAYAGREATMAARAAAEAWLKEIGAK